MRKEVALKHPGWDSCTHTNTVVKGPLQQNISKEEITFKSIIGSFGFSAARLLTPNNTKADKIK